MPIKRSISPAKSWGVYRCLRRYLVNGGTLYISIAGNVSRDSEIPPVIYLWPHHRLDKNQRYISKTVWVPSNKSIYIYTHNFIYIYINGIWQLVSLGHNLQKPWFFNTYIYIYVYVCMCVCWFLPCNAPTFLPEIGDTHCAMWLFLFYLLASPWK